jgi:hypothetical protein
VAGLGVPTNYQKTQDKKNQKTDIYRNRLKFRRKGDKVAGKTKFPLRKKKKIILKQRKNGRRPK